MTRGPHRWWLWVAPIAMLTVTDFNLRLRDPSSQQIDGLVIAEIAVYAVAATGFSLFRTSPEVRRFWRIRSLWLLAAFMTVTALWSPVPLLSLAFGAQLAVVALMAHVLAGQRGTEHFSHFLLGVVVLVLVATLSTVLLTIDRSAVTVASRSAFGWLYVHPNLVANYLAVAVTITTFYTVHNRPGRSRGWSRHVALLFLLAEIAALVATLSRTGVIAALAGATTVILLTAHRKVEAASWLLVGLLPAVVALGSQLWSLLSRGQSTTDLLSLTGRVDVWKYSLGLVQERPLIGYGFSSARNLLLPSTGLSGSHNAIIELMLSGGLFGLLFALIASSAATLSLARAVIHKSRPFHQTTLPVYVGLAVVWWIASLTETFGAGYPGLGTVLLGVLVAKSVHLEISTSLDESPRHVSAAGRHQSNNVAASARRIGKNNLL